MARVKRGIISMKRRRNILRQVKGYRFRRSKTERAAQEAIVHAGTYAFRDRRAKKRNFRRLWTLRINAALRGAGFPSYSKFINALKKKDVDLDRKVLSELAQKHPETFERVVKEVV